MRIRVQGLENGQENGHYDLMYFQGGFKVRPCKWDLPGLG